MVAAATSFAWDYTRAGATLTGETEATLPDASIVVIVVVCQLGPEPSIVAPTTTITVKCGTPPKPAPPCAPTTNAVAVRP